MSATRSTLTPGHADRLIPPWLSVVGRILLLVFIGIPVVYMIYLALSPNSAVSLGGVGLGHLTLSNFSGMWKTAPLLRGLLNSLLIAGISAVLAVALSVCAAYPLARLKIRGKRPILYGLLGTQTIPGVTLVLPFFIALASLQTLLGAHLVGSYPVVILLYMTFGLPLATWLLFVYLWNIPPELEEAAFVDGCSRFGALWRIVVPMLTPVLVVSVVFAFLVGWNDIVFASVLTNARSETISVVLQQFAGVQETGGTPLYGQLMSAAFVSGLPVVVLYLLFQRYLVSGLGAGSLAGT
jgi:ABC-type glycerol-3-phosphate transport system permease component